VEEETVARVREVRINSLTPTRLVELAQSGRIRVPVFQRVYRWRVSDVVDLFDSVIKRYPVGNLLFWERPAAADRVSLGGLTIDVPASSRALWAIDGQQRIITFAGTLLASGEHVDPRFAVCVNLETLSYRSFTEREPPAPWLPLQVAGSDRQLVDWRRENLEWLEPDHHDAVDEIASALREYPVPAYIVEAGDEREIRVIFDRMNNAGRALGANEIFNALPGAPQPASPGGLEDIVDRIDSAGFGRIRQEEVIRTLLALRRTDVSRDIREEFSGDRDREDAFRATERFLLDVVTVLREDVDIPHVGLLPYAPVIPMVASLLDRFGRFGGRAAELLRRWVWRGAALGVNIGDDVHGMRRGLRAIAEAGTPVDAVQALLSALPAVTDRWVPDLTQVRVDTAATKLNMLGMLLELPHRLGAATEQPVPSWPLTATELFDEALSPLLEIIPAKVSRDPLVASMANRLLHPPLGETVDLIDAVRNADESVLRSHCLDDECLRLLVAADHSIFLARRAALVSEAIRRQVDDHAEWGARDGRSIADIIRGTDDVA
jgi:Protein of unknown function DUF262